MDSKLVTLGSYRRFESHATSQVKSRLAYLTLWLEIAYQFYDTKVRIMRLAGDLEEV